VGSFKHELISLIVQGKMDELRFILESSKWKTSHPSVNKIHNAMFSDTAPRLPKRTTWDRSIEHAKQSKGGWALSIMQNFLSDNEKNTIRQLAINQKSTVACIGSCFASNIARRLIALGVNNTFTLRLEEAVATPLLVQTYLDSASLPSNQIPQWAERFSIHPTTVPSILKSASLLILTFGVGYDLVDKNGNLVISTTNIAENIQKGEWRFELKSPESHAMHIEKCVQIAREINPALVIVVTLSPVPLSGMYGEKHVFYANTLSKCSLALAINHAKSRCDFVYLPSFELVVFFSAMLRNGLPVWGADGTTRHPADDVVHDICSDFLTLAGFDNQR